MLCNRVKVLKMNQIVSWTCSGNQVSETSLDIVAAVDESQLSVQTVRSMWASYWWGSNRKSSRCPHTSHTRIQSPNSSTYLCFACFRWNMWEEAHWIKFISLLIYQSNPVSPFPGGSADTLCCLPAPESRAVPGGLPPAERGQAGPTGPRQKAGRGLRHHRERPDTAGSHCCGGQVEHL